VGWTSSMMLISPSSLATGSRSMGRAPSKAFSR
jgi:hypothetical protein